MRARIKIIESKKIIIDGDNKRRMKRMEVSIGIAPIFTGKVAKRILELSKSNETSLNTSYIEECKEHAKKNGWIIKKRR